MFVEFYGVRNGVFEWLLDFEHERPVVDSLVVHVEMDDKSVYPFDVKNNTVIDVDKNLASFTVPFDWLSRPFADCDVFLNGQSVSIVSRKYGSGPLYPRSSEVGSKFKAIKKRIHCRNTQAYTGFSLLRWQLGGELSDYVGAFVVSTYAAITASDELLVKSLLEEFEPLTARVDVSLRQSRYSESVVKDPYQMFLSLWTVRWHAAAYLGQKEAFVTAVKRISDSSPIRSKNRLSYAKNYAYAKFLDGYLSLQQGDCEEGFRNLRELRDYFSRLADLEWEDPPTPQHFNDLLNAGKMVYLSLCVDSYLQGKEGSYKTVCNSRVAMEVNRIKQNASSDEASRFLTQFSGKLRDWFGEDYSYSVCNVKKSLKL